MIAGVIFDIDGTLVDSVDLHAKAWQEAFADFAHAIGFAALRSQIGKGGDELKPVFLSKDELAEDGEALETHRERLFKAKYLGQVKPFPQVVDLFERLRADGIKTVLASSAKADELAAYKRIAGIENLVDVATSSSDVDKSKPHPDIFEAALSRLGAGPSAALVIGDAPYDAEAAGKAGLKTIGVLCGGFAEAELRKAGCAAIYADPADLLRRYDDWRPLREGR